MAQPTYEDSIIFKTNVNNLSGYYVYVFWGGDTPFYVGLGKKNRWRQHFHNSHEKLLSHNPHKHRKLRKIIDNGEKVGVEIAGSSLTKEQAQELEIELIARYGRCRDGGTLTNMSTGGESGAAGCEHSEQFKIKHSVTLRGKNSKVDDDLVRKAKLLFHYRGMSTKEIQNLEEFSHVKHGTITSWICKGHPNYNYVSPHLKDNKELWEEKREEAYNLWKQGNFNYTQVANILGLDRHFVSRACRARSK